MRDEELQEAVRRRYAAAAVSAAGGDYEGARAAEQSCCAPTAALRKDHECRVGFGADLYDAASADGAPEAALAASLGCGVPTGVADLHAGETVLDLGSGAGADVLISARRVLPGGRAIGLDMTTEMIELARRNASDAGVTNVEFVEGYLEDIPLPDASVDVVISNCVINLAAGKHLVLGETARAKWSGCIAGALTEPAYRAALTATGLIDIEITETHRVHPHAAAAIIRARKPVTRQEP
jgi:SAM-dependent methyltransferase